MFEVQGPENHDKVEEFFFKQVLVEHMQVPNWEAPDVCRSEGPMLKCDSRSKCSLELLVIREKTEFDNNSMNWYQVRSIEGVRV